MANQLTPPPTDNDPNASQVSDTVKKKTSAFISQNTWGLLKSWFDLLFQLLKRVTSDGNGMISINGLPVWDSDIQATGVSGFFSGVSPGTLLTNSASGIGLTNTISITVVSLTLPVGTWDVSGGVQFISSAAGLITSRITSISLVNNTGGATPSNTTWDQCTEASGVNSVMWTPQVRVVSAGAPVYLIASANFASGTVSATGFIRAAYVASI